MFAADILQHDPSAPVAVLGVGVEGRSTLTHLLAHGARRVTALDRSPISNLPDGVAAVIGERHLQDLDRFAIIFRSPSVRPDHPALEAARRRGAVVTSAVSYFLEACPCPVVGITGTVGKGTTATLAARLLEVGGFETHLGGNIGASPLDFLDALESDHRTVLEISSFQAFDLTRSPRLAVVLRTTSEHLDWHRDLAEYRRAKARLIAHQEPGDALVYNADAPGSLEIAHHARGRTYAVSLDGPVDRGIFLSAGRFTWRADDREWELPFRTKRARLPGRFNLENVAAGLAVALLEGVEPEPACAAAERFEGLPHRLELAAERGGIRFYNDSYATRPEATIGAISCFKDTPLALILGGSEKHADFTELAEMLRRHPDIRHVALIGATAERLQDTIREICEGSLETCLYADLEPAMEGALAALGDTGVVLMAPACASFGLFPNYKVRGERFRARARQLASV